MEGPTAVVEAERKGWELLGWSWLPGVLRG